MALIGFAMIEVKIDPEQSSSLKVLMLVDSY